MVKTTENLKITTDDSKVPARSIRMAQALKKNKKMGWEGRYLLLGYTQILIAWDPDFVKIVNVIPIVGGFVSVCWEGENMLRILTTTWEFRLKFTRENEAKIWF